MNTFTDSRSANGPRMSTRLPEELSRAAEQAVTEISPERQTYLKALGQIRANLGDPTFTIKRAAACLFVSERNLQRVFAAEGSGFRGELTKMRMTAATKLLTETRLPVSEVAARVGYRHPMHFSKAYRTHTGKSPRDVRRDAGLPARVCNVKSTSANPSSSLIS